MKNPAIENDLVNTVSILIADVLNPAMISALEYDPWLDGNNVHQSPIEKEQE